MQKLRVIFVVRSMCLSLALTFKPFLINQAEEKQKNKKKSQKPSKTNQARNHLHAAPSNVCKDTQNRQAKCDHYHFRDQSSRPSSAAKAKTVLYQNPIISAKRKASLLLGHLKTKEGIRLTSNESNSQCLKITKNMFHRFHKEKSSFFSVLTTKNVMISEVCHIKKVCHTYTGL